MAFFEPSIYSNNELINRLDKNKLKKILLDQKKIISYQKKILQKYYVYKKKYLFYK